MLHRISRRISGGEVLPALTVLVLGVASFLCVAMTSGVWGARAPDVRLTVGAPGKSKEFSAPDTRFSRFFLWTRISPTTGTLFTTD
jgi:hypothetical protein